MTAILLLLAGLGFAGGLLCFPWESSPQLMITASAWGLAIVLGVAAVTVGRKS